MHTGLACVGVMAEMECAAGIGWGWGIEGGGDGRSRSVDLWYPVLVCTKMKGILKQHGLN